ncbi:MAG: GNAT N-acetyltransferase [Actinobacteria bacterium]|nr:GNAT N-acetyltransferase [Actinomycetota bacterium]
MGEWRGVELDGLVLHSGRLTLRPWQPSDATQVAAMLADGRAATYLPLPTPYTADDARDFVTGLGRDGRLTGRRLDCAIAENTTGRLVGSASLRLPVTPHEVAEIGYWLATAEWGNGTGEEYATEAVRTLARFGLGNGLARIEIRCEVPNAASAAVALRAGFRFEAFRRAALQGRDGPLDAAVFARTATDPDEPVPPAWPALAPLTDGVVTVRQTGPDDWPVLLAEANNDASRQWGFGGEPMTEAVARQRASWAGLIRLTGGTNALLICDAATGAGAGIMGLHRFGPPGVVMIGYGVLPEFRGRRFTTRALRLLADWTFSRTPVARLELGCKVDNVASARAALAAGFVAEGRQAGRLPNPDGSYSDELVFGLTRPAG